MLKRLLEPHQRIARCRRRVVIQLHHLQHLSGSMPADVMRLQQVCRHGGNQGARQAERGDHREHHGFRHRNEQVVRDAGQEEHRDENDADAQQRNESGRYDLVRAIHDRGANLLPFFKVPVDVFDRHRGVVHQNTHRQCKTAQRHDIQRLADRIQGRDGRQDGERNGYGDDDG